MSKKTILSIFLITLVWGVSAQKKAVEDKGFKNEVGLNVTTLLTDLLGNSNRTETGNYLLSYKRVNGDKAIRVGTTLNWSFKKENAGFFETTLLNQNLQVRVGYEKRQTLSPRFQYYFGVDGIAGFKQEQSSASTNILQTDVNLTFGAGPVLGFQFALFERLLIGTEGSLYMAYSKGTTDAKSLSSSAVFVSKSTEGIIAQTNLPKSLFLIVKF